MASIYRPNSKTATYWVKFYIDGKFYRASLQTDDKKTADIVKSRVEIALKEGASKEKIEYLLNNLDYATDVAKKQHPKYEKTVAVNELKKYEKPEQADDLKQYEKADFPTSIDRLLHIYYEMKKSYKAPRTKKYDEQRLQDFADWVKKDDIKDVTSQDIIEYINHKCQEMKAVSVNRYIQNIKAFFNFIAGFDGKYIAKNPAEKVSKINVPKQYPRFLTLEEIDAIRKNCSLTFKPMYEFYIRTGLRKSELVYLEWEDIDLEKKELCVRPKEGIFTPKNKKPRTIPIDDELCGILKDVKGKNKTGYVFGLSPTKPRKHRLHEMLASAVKKAGIKGHVSYNTLRHTYASYITQEGGIAAAAELLGHSNIRLTHDYYARLSKEFKAKVVGKLPY